MLNKYFRKNINLNDFNKYLHENKDNHVHLVCIIDNMVLHEVYETKKLNKSEYIISTLDIIDYLIDEKYANNIHIGLINNFYKLYIKDENEVKLINKITFMSPFEFMGNNHKSTFELYISKEYAYKILKNINN